MSATTTTTTSVVSSVAMEATQNEAGDNDPTHQQKPLFPIRIDNLHSYKIHLHFIKNSQSRGY
jgi:hypothetical protein